MNLGKPWSVRLTEGLGVARGVLDVFATVHGTVAVFEPCVAGLALGALLYEIRRGWRLEIGCSQEYLPATIWDQRRWRSCMPANQCSGVPGLFIVSTIKDSIAFVAVLAARFESWCASMTAMSAMYKARCAPESFNSFGRSKSILGLPQLLFTRLGPTAWASL